MPARADQRHRADSTPQPRINETGVPKSQIPLRSVKGTAGNARARIAGGLRFVVVRTAMNNESRAVVILDHGLDIEQIEKDFGLKHAIFSHFHIGHVTRMRPPLDEHTMLVVPRDMAPSRFEIIRRTIAGFMQVNAMGARGHARRVDLDQGPARGGRVQANSA